MSAQPRAHPLPFLYYGLTQGEVCPQKSKYHLCTDGPPVCIFSSKPLVAPLSSKLIFPTTLRLTTPSLKLSARCVLESRILNCRQVIPPAALIAIKHWYFSSEACEGSSWVGWKICKLPHFMSCQNSLVNELRSTLWFSELCAFQNCKNAMWTYIFSPFISWIGTPNLTMLKMWFNAPPAFAAFLFPPSH